MVNTSDSIRLIEDSVIHPSVLLILIRFFKKTIKLYCIPKDKSRVKKPKHFIQNWVSIYWIPSTHPRIPRGFNGKESACQAANPNSIPELGKSPGGGNGNPLHYSCLKNPMERSLEGYHPWGHRVSHDLMITSTYPALLALGTRAIKVSQKWSLIWWCSVSRGDT